MMEPWQEYNFYEAWKEANYQKAIEGKTCKDCYSCYMPDESFENPSHICWCDEFETFMDASEPISQHGCDDFKA